MRRLVVTVVTAALAVAGLAVLEAPAATAATAPNLLSANQASIESTSAGFATGYGREKISRTRWAKAAHGHAVLVMTSTTTKAMAARTVMAGQIVRAGATYSGGMLVQPSSNVRKPVSARAFVVFTAASGKVLATVAGSWVTTKAGRWVRLGVSRATAPARTVSVSLYAEVYTKAKGLTYFSDEWGLWQASTLPTWAMPPTADSITPTVPVVRATSNAASTTVALGFSSTDNVGVSGYRIWFAPGTGATASGTPTATVTSGSFVRPSLQPGTYSAIVSAFDRAGHQAFASRVAVTLAPPPSTANLLVPTEASFESGIAGIVQPGDSTGAVISLTRSTAQTAAGASSLRIAVVSAGGVSSGTVTIRTERSWTPAVAGQDYYGSLLLLPPASGHQAQATLNFYNKYTNNIGSSSGSVTALPSGSWTRVRAGGTAPAGTAFVALVLTLDGAAGPTAGDVFYSDAWGVWQSSTLPAWGMPTVPQGVVAAFIGDSYTLGVGAQDAAAPQYTSLDRFTTRITTTMGWRELNLSRGGTGFTNSASGPGCGSPYCAPYSDQVALSVAAHADVVFVTGGRNDGAASSTTEKAAVSAAIATLAAQLPSARTIVVSPLWDRSPPITPSWLTHIADYESAAVTAAASPKVTFIPQAYEWLVGFDSTYWWSVDGIHPNGKGYGVIAANIIATLPDRPR